MNQFDNTASYDIPVDPMDDLQCESCQKISKPRETHAMW